MKSPIFHPSEMNSMHLGRRCWRKLMPWLAWVVPGLVMPLLASAALDPLHRDQSALTLIIRDSFSRAEVTATNTAGGLVGSIGDATVARVYSAGSVVANGVAGGLIGAADEAAGVGSAYWDVEASGMESSAAGEPRSGAEMRDPHAANTYEGWDFATVWAADTGVAVNGGYPWLRVTAVEMFSLVLQVSPAGAGWASGGGRYIAGTSVSISAGAAEGFSFLEWREGSHTIANQPVVTVVVSADRTLVAVFETSGGGNPDFAGGDGTVDDPYRIATAQQFDRVRDYLGAHFRLTADVDMGQLEAGSGGWVPVADLSTDQYFSGVIDGAGHVVRNLRIDRPDADYQALFGLVGMGAVIRNLGLEGGRVNGRDGTAAMVGYAFGAIIERCFSTVELAGNAVVGGLVSVSDQSWIADCFVDARVTAADNAVGGLVGYQIQGLIERCYARGEVTGMDGAGGLIGVQGTEDETGLELPVVRDCYAAANVTGYYFVGGLIGLGEGTIEHCYAYGKVRANESGGGLIGILTAGTVTQSYWDIGRSGHATGDWGTGLGTAALTVPYASNAYVDWDFESAWATDSVGANFGYPWLPGTGLRPWDRGKFATAHAGWDWSPWFGTYAQLNLTWYWHHAHGPLYFTMMSHPGSIYCYQPDRQWLWTNSRIYPWAFQFSTRSWVHVAM